MLTAVSDRVDTAGKGRFVRIPFAELRADHSFE